MSDSGTVSALVDHRVMRGNTCSIAGCDKPVYVLSRGWCSTHYHRWKRHGDPEASVRTYGPKGAATCTESGCVEPVHANGLCMAHGNAAYAAQLAAEPCSIEGCKRPNHRRGWCSAHYQRWRKYGNPLDGGPVRRDRGTGMPHDWYSEQRRRQLDPPDAETLAYVEILRRDPCSYCGRPWGATDHIEPVRRGGAHHWTNLTAACTSCNSRKQMKTLLGFMLDRVVA